MKIKKIMIYIFVFWASFFAAYSDAQTPERWMWCGDEKAWIGDSLAEVQMKCGRPEGAIKGPPMLITENQGPVSITRPMQEIIYIYPGYRGDRKYYLKFENYELVYIGQEVWGKIPR